MKSSYRYKSLVKDGYYIDKTDVLEKGIIAFPSIYVEGAAASGKSTAVKLLVSHHPEVCVDVYDMSDDLDIEKHLQDELVENRWIIIENIHKLTSDNALNRIVHFIRHMHDSCRVILIGREKMPHQFLDMFWKDELMLVTQQDLKFKKEDIQNLLEHWSIKMDVQDIYEGTGGWAGCVMSMIKLAKAISDRGETVNAQILCQSYEVRSYIEKEIVAAQNSKEQEIIRRAMFCPWVNELLCRDIWGLADTGETFENLTRKGLLKYDKRRHRWELAAILRNHSLSGGYKEVENVYIERHARPTNDFWIYLGRWYEQHGFITEALQCFCRSQNKVLYMERLIAHYEQVPFLEIPWDEVMMWKQNTPENLYLKGMNCYAHQDFKGLEKEIKKVKSLLDEYKKTKTFLEDNWQMNDDSAYELCKEIYLNLCFVNPALSFESWMNLLTEYCKNQKSIRLYHILGNSHMPLCGLRDLSGLFACTKKEENQKAKIWRECLDENAWTFYRLSKIDFYIETKNYDALQENDLSVLSETDNAIVPWQVNLAKMYLLCKLQEIMPDEGIRSRIHKLREVLIDEEHSICVQNTEAVYNLYAIRCGEAEQLAMWLRYSGNISLYEDISERNYAMISCQVKGCLMLGQYKRALRILRHLIPYAKNYKRHRFLTELLFQQAIAASVEEGHNQGIRSMISSVLVSGSCRYVYFYTVYGQKGFQMLEAYVEWMRTSTPEGWHRKRKYNYGNVLRMPMEDYLENVLRLARRNIKTYPGLSEQAIEESLTMMETIVLQCISRGLTNAEMCEELNLRLTTVKTHIYSMYKKLNVNSRVQAILKGKEMGIIK